MWRGGTEWAKKSRVGSQASIKNLCKIIKNTQKYFSLIFYRYLYHVSVCQALFSYTFFFELSKQHKVPSPDGSKYALTLFLLLLLFINIGVESVLKNAHFFFAASQRLITIKMCLIRTYKNIINVSGFGFVITNSNYITCFFFVWLFQSILFPSVDASSWQILSPLPFFFKTVSKTFHPISFIWEKFKDSDWMKA